MTNQWDYHAAAVLEGALSRRYPHVSAKVAIQVCAEDGVRSQAVTFTASRSQLIADGLITDSMSQRPEPVAGGRWTTPCGDHYWVRALPDGGMELLVWTHEHPRERPRIAVNDAKRALSPIFRRSPRNAKVG